MVNSSVVEDPWPGERGRTGGVDRVAVPGPGTFLLCGKRFIGPQAGVTVERLGVTTVVCLTEEFELVGHFPEYVRWLRDPRGAEVVWTAIPDLGVAPPDVFAALVFDVRRRLDAGETVLAHCGAGIGRAGTLAAGVLSTYGVSLDDAIVRLRSARPMAGPETGSQMDLVRSFVESLR